MPKIIFQPLMICNPPTPTTGKAILLAADFKSAEPQ